jgi:hypothetical protein
MALRPAYARRASSRRGDSGSAARFFYSSKADADDRLGSKHPTVKPVDLMRWLVRLVTPKGGLVLDPFAGSGTTGMACMAEGFDCHLIEREAEYAAAFAAVSRCGRGGYAPQADPVKALFDAGVKLLTDNGSDERNARSVIGKFRKDVGDDAVMGAIAEARRLQITEPIAWMTQRFAGKPGQRESWNEARIRKGQELLRQ